MTKTSTRILVSYRERKP